MHEPGEWGVLTRKSQRKRTLCKRSSGQAECTELKKERAPALRNSGKTRVPVLQGMEMMKREEELARERQALRLLCSNLIRATTRVELCGLLDSSLFVDELHRVAFEEIRAAGAVPAKRLREELPGRITNRGFPDFELLEFLGKDLATQGEIEQLFMSALRLIQERHASDGSELEN
jgi:hypothetical protein